MNLLKNKYFILAFFICLISIAWMQQQPDKHKAVIDFKAKTNLSIFKLSENKLVDNNHSLSPIFEKLYRLRTGNDSSKLVILHIGDSHIQGGFLSGRNRISFQQYFGNAGRGLITPYKLTHSNEPKDYSILSNVNWGKARCIDKKSDVELGVSAISISSQSPVADILITVNSTEDQDYSFNKLTYFSPNNSSLQPDLSSGWSFSKNSASEIQLEQPTHCINLIRNKSDSSNLMFSGVSVENGKSGVLYHSIGVNGAHCQDYLNHPEFFHQTALLKPDLIIVSLGTNEAFGKNFTKREFDSQLTKFINLLKEENRSAVFLITTPAQVYNKKKVRRRLKFVVNKKCDLAAETVVDFGKRNNIAVWDMYRATGGNKSASIWFKNHLFGPDRVHFTEMGYFMQSDLFFTSFINAYNKYVDVRPE